MYQPLFLDFTSDFLYFILHTEENSSIHAFSRFLCLGNLKVVKWDQFHNGAMQIRLYIE